jgi:uncharacterized protein YecE (DUF72 family)
MIRVGVGGWNFAEWRGSFYPKGLSQKKELEFASRKLTSIEINATYYGSQKPESFARWHDETPDDFVFAVKAPRFATNRRILAEAGPSIDMFFKSGVLGLKSKLGPINWQFSEYKKFEPDDFGKFLKLLPSSIGGQKIQHALEVRNEAFRDKSFFQMAKACDAAIVISADSDFPEIDEPTAPFAYVRIMGTQETAALGYSAKALDQWAARARQWSDGGKRDVFFYVISGFKPKNPQAAMALIERL